ncbi:MAG: hypothetical protein ABL917_02620 [Parcubacteria group bacterium]
MDNIISYLNPVKIQNLYLQFLANFPVGFQPLVSGVVAIIIIYAVFRIIKRDFIFILALVILVPTSIPVLKSLWVGLVSVIKYLFNLAS